jgi:hypothetical protein
MSKVKRELEESFSSETRAVKRRALGKNDYQLSSYPLTMNALGSSVEVSRKRMRDDPGRSENNSWLAHVRSEDVLAQNSACGTKRHCGFEEHVCYSDRWPLSLSEFRRDDEELSEMTKVSLSTFNLKYRLAWLQKQSD